VPDASAWVLEGFLDRLDAWLESEPVSDDLRVIVTDWVFTRDHDPYQDARRAGGFDNLWFSVVPESRNEHGRVVVCTYWIEDSRRTVRCDNFATLSWPV
jgi:hypothetical protein